jgi:hypothetical protein
LSGRDPANLLLASRKPRLGRLDGLDPQREVGHLDRQWVPIDALDAGAHELTQRMAIVFGRGGAFGAIAPNGSRSAVLPQQEMARTAAGPTTFNDKSTAAASSASGLHAVEDWVECAIKQASTRLSGVW